MKPLLLLLGCLTHLVSQPSDVADTTVIKYFPTQLIRSAILNEPVDPEELQGQAYFKAVYNNRGKLLKVEYVPAPSLPRGKASNSRGDPLTLYYRYWNPQRRELAEGLTKKDLPGKSYYQAFFDSKGRIRNVVYYNADGRRVWTYHLIWDKSGMRSAYVVEFHVRKPLTTLNAYLFATDVSEMRPGWVAKFKGEYRGIPRTVEVYDPLGNLYYYYRFKYRLERETPTLEESITSVYYRADSTIVGSHKLTFNKDLRLKRIDYYTPTGKLQLSKQFAYARQGKGTLMTVTNAEGELLEKRFIPRPMRLGKAVKRSREITKEEVLKYFKTVDVKELSLLVKQIEDQYGVTLAPKDTMVVTKEVETEVPAPAPEEEASEEPVVAEELAPAVIERRYQVGLGASYAFYRAQYLSSAPVYGWALRVRTPYTFTFWSQSFTVGWELQRGTFNKNNRYWFVGPELSLATGGYFSWMPPVTFNVVMGSLGKGYGLSGGGEVSLNDFFPFSFPLPVEMVLRVSAVLATNIDGQGTRTGFLESSLTARYSLPF